MCLKFIVKKRFLVCFCKNLRIFAQTTEKSFDEEKKYNVKRPTERSVWSILLCDNNDKQRKKKRPTEKDVDAKQWRKNCIEQR